MLRDRRVTCSISPGTYSQKLVWYLANIFSIGRRLYHHWTVGIRCLKTSDIQSNIKTDQKHISPDKDHEFTYSKSVTAFSSATGVNLMTFLFSPSTHAVSGELVNTRPGGENGTIVTSLLFDLGFWAVYSYKIWLHARTLPCRKFSVNLSEIHWTTLTPNLVPKFLSKGEGAPP